jgi:Mg-chelatase subunit ChlD
MVAVPANRSQDRHTAIVAWVALLFGVVLLADTSLAQRRSARGPVETATGEVFPAVDKHVARAALQRLYQRLATGTPNKGVLAALSDLAGSDHPLIVDGLLELLGHGDPYLRPTARRVLGSLSSPESLERIRSAGLHHREPSVREQVLVALADGRPTGIDWLAAAEAALDDPAAAVRAAAVRAIGLGRSRHLIDTLAELSDDPSVRVRMALPQALVRLVGKRTLPLLKLLSGDPRWRVRLGVVLALIDLKTRRAVELLVDMLENDEGRVREDILTALKSLTGKAHGLNMKAWRRFIEIAPDDYLSRADSDKLSPKTTLGSVARYYGLWTLSTRFLFVTDLSTSMDHVDPGRYGNAPGLSRLAVTRDELTRLVDDLGDDVHFNLATFSDSTTLWRGELSQASKRNKSAALKQIDHYRTIGGTNIFSSLELAFDAAEEQLNSGRDSIVAADTVFLLTDGVPSSGRLTDTDLLLEHVAERNRVLGLRFHCVALTRQALPRDFLARLSKRSGGQYVSPLD